MISKEISEQFAQRMGKCGAHLTGHFLLSSGLHSTDYLQCALFLAHPKSAAWAGEMLSKEVREMEPDIIVSPAMGGLFVGHEIGWYLNLPHLFCERVDGVLTLKRFPNPGNMRFVVTEDVLTTGKSTIETARVMEALGGTWVGAASLVNRSGVENPLPVPCVSLWNVEFPVYKPEECPCCREGLSLVKPGSRPAA